MQLYFLHFTAVCSQFGQFDCTWFQFVRSQFFNLDSHGLFNCFSRIPQYSYLPHFFFS